MDATVAAAAIAAVVSSLGIAANWYWSRHQLRATIGELELKRRELDASDERLRAEQESVRQGLLRDVVAKRMLAYADLWRVFITYERNWGIEKKPLDAEWAGLFLRAINECNAEHGVFFSQPVYEAFFEYRGRLIGIVESANSGRTITRSQFDSLVDVSTIGLSEGRPALAAAMKNDLGSYMRVAIQSDDRSGPHYR